MYNGRPVIVHIRSHVPGVSDLFMAQREFRTREQAEAFVKHTPTPLRHFSSVYATIVN